MLLACARPASAQVATGIPPFASLTPSTFDSVNNANLNVHFTIPVFSRAGRAGFSFSYALSYDSSIWMPLVAWYPTSNWEWRGTTEALMGYTVESETAGECYVNLTWYYYNLWL